MDEACKMSQIVKARIEQKPVVYTQINSVNEISECNFPPILNIIINTMAFSFIHHS